MSNSEFEKNVRQEMEDLSLEPSDNVWDRVEASLPDKKRRRWFLIFIPLLVAGSIYLMYNDLGLAERGSVNGKISAGTNNTTEKKSTKKTGLKSESKSTADNRNGTEMVKPLNSRERNKERSTALPKRSDRQPVPFSKTKIPFKSDARLAVTVTSPAPEADEKNDLVVHQDSDLKRKEQLKPVLENESSNTETAITGKQKPDTLPALSVKIDTTASPINKKENKKIQSKWLYGIVTGAGLANIKNDVFSNSRVYTNDLSTGSPLNNPVFQTASISNTPTASIAFTTGIYAERVFNTRLSLNTGLNYIYLSNQLSVGERVDSSSSFLTNSGDTQVSFYYRNGDSKKYRNEFHFLQLPIVLQYKPFKQLPLYGESGITASYLISAKVLQYSATRNAYFTDSKSLNRLLLGMQAGVGADLKKLKFGYRLNYSFSSVIKGETRQFPVSSIIYVQLPLKKY